MSFNQNTDHTKVLTLSFLTTLSFSTPRT